MTGRVHVGMARAQGLLPDGQRALEEQLRLPVLPLISIHSRQVVDGLANRGMVRAKRFFADDQRALVEFLRLVYLP